MIKQQQYSLGPAAEGADSPFRSALGDFFLGLQLMPIWGVLGWHDIRQRYRRSVIGPFWLSISTSLMVVALGYVYSGLFNQGQLKYLPFISVGLVVWGFISTILTEASTVFIIAEVTIKQIRQPLTVHVCRLVWRNLIVFCHNSAVIIGIMVWAKTPITQQLFLVPVALFIICFNGLNIGLCLGILSARFRDFVQIVASSMQLLFFVTPIMWDPSVFSSRNVERGWVVEYNPLYHFIEIVRAPVLGEAFAFKSWVVVLISSGVTWALAMLTLMKFRHRVAYWL